MRQIFYKYQGAGNDFVMIDNRSGTFPKGNNRLIKALCDRRFGIGADGAILIEECAGFDFKMIYFNADGYEGSMCGNGGRCAFAFAGQLGMVGPTAKFEAVDGTHFAAMDGRLVNLKMNDVTRIDARDNYMFLNTGSPHHVEFVSDIGRFDTYNVGKAIAHGSLYGVQGSNVNFIEKVTHDTFEIRTYERGVEAETLACGTGAVAAAIAAHHAKATTSNRVTMKALGGDLEVSFTPEQGLYREVFLKGDARLVYEGAIDLERLA